LLIVNCRLHSHTMHSLMSSYFLLDRRFGEWEDAFTGMYFMQEASGNLLNLVINSPIDKFTIRTKIN
ncbi:MAG: hypothetical protein ACK51L_04955, partial [bacterium]